ncbi:MULTISPECIES: glycerophosphodiester phosphodiesterase [Bacillus]|uniref:glycerophosphodiester phosphodiesterase n=1 Tax=Bacillus TaxID=1386 RepID=UPI000C23693E|nr:MULTISPECIES: glycerophosphodiester phosphodiesterase family protein [Bacillus]MDH6596257.1 glycerophosphoryl diester phosphodiesterase [Bacillus aerius]MEC0970829.1 glycerophosphodiester phosphodiesterase family protein [Bacillus altitudinis]MEC1004496.1 glycerophosphodiester phosphodiesterase family protein [Bacillus altitudinis]PJI11746.1 glycerophosphodiester phosphodiesterase [Bacillus altitudinis]PKQ84474.1 glycerophosphodiester phosphodiesterase [Bacillus altitudinis]
MYIIAHRGSSSAAPENTIAAFDVAVEQGADYIELDVQMTMDQHVVVIHDDTVERTTNGNGLVKSYTLDQLKKLDAGSWFDQQYTNERIPTLQEILERYSQRIGILIEIKHPKRQIGIEKAVARIINRFAYSRHIIIQSFDVHALQRIKAFAPSLRTALIIKPDAFKLTKRKLTTYSSFANCLNMKKTMINRWWIDRIHTFEMDVFIWTVKDQKTADRIKKYPIDGVVTDNPLFFQKEK